VIVRRLHAMALSVAVTLSTLFTRFERNMND